jgi:lysophospholipase L1-like esterase
MKAPALAILTVALLALPASSSARLLSSKPLPLSPGTRYLALGDSVTFGYQESTAVPAPNYHDQANFLGYPEHLGAALHVVVANAACPGETSSSLINPSVPSNGCENALGNVKASYRANYPLHVKYKGSQLAFALAYLKAHANVRLVSLMIGANDYFVCVESTKDGCTSTSELKGVETTVAKNVKTILSAIRNKAHYEGQLAIVNYYSLNYASAADNAQSALLNTVVDKAAKPFHVEVANGYVAFEAQAVHYAGSTCDAGLLTELGKVGTCGIHPSYAGQALLAEALERVVKL